MKPWFRSLLTVVGLLAATFPAFAQDTSGNRQAGSAKAEDLVVDYPSRFFERYQPNTALDMVKQVPGFQINDGADKRGFGGAAGNILINDRRPSAKQDKPSAILARIPAANVARIELIRGQVRDIDLLGYSAVANVILNKEAPAAVRWEAFNRWNFSHGIGPAPGGSISLSDHWKDIEYNVGVDARMSNYADAGTENVYDAADNLTERRIYDDGTKGFEGYDFNTYLNAASWLGKNFVQLNSSFGVANRDETLIVHRLPQAAGAQPSDEVYRSKRRNKQFELGLDAERLLHPDLLGKGILLFYRLDQQPFSSERDLTNAGLTTAYQRAETDTRKTEAIARLEFDWAGWEDHTVQANFEGAYNALDSSLVQTEDTGAGPVIVDVPGANTKVEEYRGDFLLQDTWTVGNFEFNYGLGAETSTIKQSGDANLKRHFFFIKPRAVAIWSPTPQRQTRVRFEREVAQLDFEDFVSASVFLDNDLALGNPNLKPDTTWIAEISHEQRFGDLGVVKLTAFHHWISDTLDLLPVTDTEEVPGNIGSARRWGLELESTVPLGWAGLEGARLDLKGRWQDSTVTDPVTGRDRVLSGVKGLDPGVTFDLENEWAFKIAYRQDFRAARWAWGVDTALQDQRPVYKVDELQVYDEGLALNAFIETTRWFGLKIRLEGVNLLNYHETRDRTVYVGRRALTDVDFREFKSLTNGARITVTISGTF